MVVDGSRCRDAYVERRYQLELAHKRVSLDPNTNGKMLVGANAPAV